MQTNWMIKELNLLRPGQLKPGGFDFSKNNSLEGDEQLKTYNNNRIPGYDSRAVGDWTDWLAFYRKNVRRFTNLGGIFAIAGKFRPTSPLHIVALNESSIAAQTDIKTLYKRTYQLLLLVKSNPTAPLTAKQRAKLAKIPTRRRAKYRIAMMHLNAIFRAMQKLGMLQKRRSPLATSDMKHASLGYTAATYVILAVAHEMDWPIHAVRVPHNIFVRWDKGKVKVNADRGKFYDDAYYIRKHKLTAALAAKNKPYLRSLKLKGFVAIVSRMVGEAFYHKKKYALANKYLTTALNLDGTFVRAFNIRGLARYFLGKIPGSINDFLTATRRNPKYGHAHQNLGTAYLINRQASLAIKHLTIALTLRKKRAIRAHILFYRSRAYLNIGKQANAEADLKAAQKLDSNLVDLHHQFGRLYFDQNKLPLALKHAKLSLAKDGASVKIYLLLGRIHFAQKQYGKARQYFGKAIAEDSSDYSSHYNRGLANIKLGKFKEAIQDFRKAILNNGKCAEAYYHSALARLALAQVLQKNGQTSEARAQRQTAASEQRRAAFLNPRYKNPGRVIVVRKLVSYFSIAAYRSIRKKLWRAFKIPNTGKGNLLKKYQLYQSALGDFRRALIKDKSNAAWIRKQIAMLEKILRELKAKILAL